VVIGDARVKLAADPQAPDGHFDAVMVDAFSGDAIPTHLLTKEALGSYLEKIKEDGLLVFNISNRFYDLRAVLTATGKAAGLEGAYRLRLDERRLEDMEIRSRWYVLTRNRATLDALADHGWQLTTDEPALAAGEPWTDDYVNVLAPLWSEVRRNRSM
jgi:spermidine synthase